MIEIGATREEQVPVNEDVAISFLGAAGARVLSTPHMIGFMERTCRNLVLPMLEPGDDTIGTHVDVYHLGASPIGMTATFRAEITSIEGRRVRFKVLASDERDKLGEGTHERTIITVERFAAKMQAKLNR